MTLTTFGATLLPITPIQSLSKSVLKAKMNNAQRFFDAWSV